MDCIEPTPTYEEFEYGDGGRYIKIKVDIPIILGYDDMQSSSWPAMRTNILENITNLAATQIDKAVREALKNVTY